MLRLSSHLFALALLILGLVVFGQNPVFAQDVAEAAGTVVNFGIIVWETIVPTLAAALGAVLIFAVNKAMKLFGIKTDDSQRVLIGNVIDSGINMALKKARTMTEGKLTVDVQSLVAAEASRYVLERVPDAVKHFKLTPEDVRDIIAAKLSPDQIAGASK